MSKNESSKDKISTEQREEQQELTDKVNNLSDKDKNTSADSSLSVLERKSTLSKKDLEILNYTEFNTPAKILILAEVLIKSSLVPLKKPEDVVVAVMTGQRLGLPFDTAVSQIYPINGRATLGVHIMRGQLLKHGVYFKRLREAEEYYEFVKADKEGNVILKDKGVDKEGKPLKVPTIVGYGFIDEQPENTSKRKIDVKTQYSFERDIQNKFGKVRTVKLKSEFSYNDAALAGFFEKDVWIKQFKRMLDARAFTIGAKEIAADFLYGLPSTDEMLDVEGKTYTMNDDFSVTQEIQNNEYAEEDLSEENDQNHS